MKRFIKFIAISMLIVTLAFGVYKITNKYDLRIMNKDISWAIKAKGCEGAKAFDFDKNNNLYIAFKDEIKVIDGNSNKEYVIKIKGFNIYDIVCMDNFIIIATDNRVVKYDINSGGYNEIISGLPNLGENKDTKLLLYNDKLYVTVGSNTNSGVVDDEGAAVDKASFQWISTGVTYGDEKTGGFSSYMNSVNKGGKIEEATLSNATILVYDFKNSTIKNYATGIRGIKGIDVNSEGKIIAIFSGMEEKGNRPIKDDSDYIYEIKENVWYGWPDFSGGDVVTSARFFSDVIMIKCLIENHPTETPYGPIYQYKNISALNGLAVEKHGGDFPKDTIIFADNKEKSLYGLSKQGVANKIVDLGSKSNVQQIKCVNGKIFVLDDGNGCVYELKGNMGNSIFNLPKIIWIFIIIFTIVIVMCVVYKLNGKFKRK